MEKNYGPIEIGKIMTNLQSLEFERSEQQRTASNFDFDQLKDNDWIEENYLTNFDSLAIIIDKCNSELRKKGKSEQIDKSLVDLRDALAHGRVLSSEREGFFRLMKFSKPNQGKVQVIFCVDMTPEWLKSQVLLTYEEIQKIVKIGRKLGLTCFPE